MANEKRLIYANTESCNEATKQKVRTHFARIIVDGKAENPYYSILYFDPTDGEYHIGFSSYYLEYVFQWLKEEFEIVGDAFFSEPVVHGRWEDEYGGKYANHKYRCSVCKEKSLYTFVRGLLGGFKEMQALTPYCPNCGAKMDGDGNA